MATYIKKDFASPNGPILLLSAKGSTTASIAEANGVKDFSGNGNHGTASGGIGVTNDYEMGSCFDFTDLSAVQSINGAFQNPSSSLTLSIRYKRTGSIAQRNQLLIGDANSSNVCRLSIYITTRTDPDLVTVAKYSNSDNDPLTCNINTTLGKTTSDVHLYTVTYDAGASLLSLYIDDTLAETKTVPVQTFTVSKFMLGYPTASYRPVGLISEARIYPRALSAAEVKYLYNGFQPNIIVGQTIPSGAILDLSARGLTTAGIAQANGVVDRSGNMNAGTAYGGISIVNDSSLGECFSFDGSDDYMEFNKSSFMDAFSNIQGLTVAFKMKPNNVSGKEIVLFEGFYDEATTLFAIRLYQGKINYYVRRRISDSWVTYSSSLSITQDGVYRVAALFDWQNEKVSLYIDGTLDSTYDTSFGAGNLLNSPTFIWLGKHSKVNRCYRGLLTDVLVYPRVLTASEVQQLADASLKNITNIKYGSSDVRHIYYRSNLIYTRTALYSSRPPVGTVEQITTVVAAASQYQNGSALVLRNGNVKGIVCTDYVNSKVMFFLPDGTRSPGTFTDFTHANLNNGVTYICEDDEGYIYVTGANTGYLLKLKPTVSGSTYSFTLVASLKLGNMVAANECTYNPARNAIIVVGWDSGGGTSHCYQVPKTLASATSIANWWGPTLGGCMTKDGTKLFVGLYSGSCASGLFTFSSASDTAEKTSYTTIRPNNYSGKISGSSDSRFWIAADDDYMYWNMLNGTLYRYDTSGNYVSTITTAMDSPRQDGSIIYDAEDNALTFVRTDGYAYKIYL